MKKLILTSTIGMMMFLAASQSKAILFTDLDTINQKLTAGPTASSTYTGTFNIVDDGFQPGVHNVWAAGITFWLTDDGDRAPESFTVNMGGTYNTSQYTTFLVLGTTQVGIDLLANLNADGILSYTVTATTGDFWLKSALLFAQATVPQGNENRVPDNGSTLILAAFALFGLTFVGHRIAKHC